MSQPLLLMLGALGGGLVCSGLGLLAWGVARTGTARGAWARLRAVLSERGRGRRLAVSVAVGALVWLATGWPVAAMWALAGAWWLPAVLGPEREHQEQVARIEAVASWAEHLRDLMAGASGLQQAIAKSASIAPEPIRPQVHQLAEELRHGRPPSEALDDFAETIAVPNADRVCAALAKAASRHAADLGSLLSDLAHSTREQAATLMRIAATRARVRTSMRIIVATTLAFAAGLLVFNQDYLAPYDTVLGQLILAVIGALWAIATAWITRLARVDLGPRTLRPSPQEIAS